MDDYLQSQMLSYHSFQLPFHAYLSPYFISFVFILLITYFYLYLALHSLIFLDFHCYGIHQRLICTLKSNHLLKFLSSIRIIQLYCLYLPTFCCRKITYWRRLRLDHYGFRNWLFDSSPFDCENVGSQCSLMGFFGFERWLVVFISLS